MGRWPGEFYGDRTIAKNIDFANDIGVPFGRIHVSVVRNDAPCREPSQRHGPKGARFDGGPKVAFFMSFRRQNKNVVCSELQGEQSRVGFGRTELSLRELGIAFTLYRMGLVPGGLSFKVF